MLALEIGVFLIFVPWSSVWDQNLLLGHPSWLKSLLRSYYVRGAISALGVVNIGVGLAEALSLVKMASAAKPASRKD